MSDLTAVSGARIFDGEDWHDDAALLIEFGYVAGIVPAAAVPAHAERVVLDGGTLVPGFVDLQVNGGGGVLFNNAPTLESIRTICAAHAQFGTTALLPTLITDTAAINDQAIAAGTAAADARVPGFIGLHLEGPHLSLARKGTHDPSLIRPMDADDLARLTGAARTLPNLICTVAADSVLLSRSLTLRPASTCTGAWPSVKVLLPPLVLSSGVWSTGVTVTVRVWVTLLLVPSLRVKLTVRVMSTRSAGLVRMIASVAVP